MIVCITKEKKMNFKEYFSKNSLEDVLLRELTVKEIEVIEHIASGLSVMETAKELIIALSTLKSHLSNIRNKFKLMPEEIVNTRVMLCIFWQEYGSQIRKKVSS